MCSVAGTRHTPTHAYVAACDPQMFVWEKLELILDRIKTVIKENVVSKIYVRSVLCRCSCERREKLLCMCERGVVCT